MQETIKYQSKKEGDKDQESIQLSTTPDPGYQLESAIVTIRQRQWAVEYHKQSELKKASKLATVGPDNLNVSYCINAKLSIGLHFDDQNDFQVRYQTLLQIQKLNKLWRKSG